MHLLLEHGFSSVWCASQVRIFAYDKGVSLSLQWMCAIWIFKLKSYPNLLCISSVKQANNTPLAYANMHRCLEMDTHSRPTFRDIVSSLQVFNVVFPL